MRKSFKVGALVASAALAGLLLVAGPSLAGVARYPSTITLEVTHPPKATVFEGRVRSPKPRCERNRRVRITAGNHGVGGQPLTEGETTTDEFGRYELSVASATNSIGAYQAIALRKERPRYVCKRAISEIVN